MCYVNLIAFNIVYFVSPIGTYILNKVMIILTKLYLTSLLITCNTPCMYCLVFSFKVFIFSLNTIFTFVFVSLMKEIKKSLSKQNIDYDSSR